jgi:hypothetical protein
MNKNAPYEHENVEGLDKLANLEVCIDVEAPLQQVQASHTPKKLVIKIPKATVYNKRTMSDTMHIDVE